MDAAKLILITIVTSATTVGVLAFILRHYLSKWIDLRFKPLEHQLQLEFEERRKLSEALIDRRIGIYPEVLETTYRLRKMLEDGLAQEAAYQWHEDIPVLTHHLTENLFKWRAFLPDLAFEPLHEYKRLCQDIVLILDVLTREDKIKDRNAYVAQFPELKTRVLRLQALYPAIQKVLSFQRGSA